MRSEKGGPNRSERSERSETNQRERSEKSESPLRTRTSDHEFGLGPSASQIATNAFNGRWVFWEAGGTVKIPAPAWLDWPHDTLADWQPVRPPVAELAAQSKGKRK